jgi:hypothetical protein
MRFFLLSLLTLSAISADSKSADLAISDAEHIQLLDAQLAAERADHAVDKAKLDYFQSNAARAKAFADATKTLNDVLQKRGCTAAEVETRTCQISDKGGKLAVIKNPPPPHPPVPSPAAPEQ